VEWWQVLLAVAGSLLVLWLVLLAALWSVSRGQDPLTVQGALRLLPDVVRLVRRLAGDPSLPRGVRLRLGLLVAYLVTPLDLVPDVVPVLGYADDVLVTALVLRSVVRAAGPDAIDRHWPGTPAGLAAVRRLAGVPG
jgi:uncharacterized membrane protein YkvA (DUF1232 family)